MAAMLQTILLIVLTNTISSNTPPPPTYSNALILCAPSKQCVINCPNKNHCTNKTIICPSHQNCIITCHAPHSCSNTTIIANHSSHLTIHALSAYSTTHSNIYCPSSASSRCQIYAHSPSNNQWNNMNLHINTHTNLTLSCHCHSNQECANDASISLTKHHNNSYTKCLLSNRNYKCIPTHSQMRTLLSITTPIPNNITLTTKPVHTAHTSPFGIQLTATQISWVLFAAALLVMSLFCALICLIYCLCKQRRHKRHSKSSLSVGNSNNSTDMRLRYLVLAYQDGNKIKIPFDISTLDRLNCENNDNLNKNTNYLSDSLHAALSDTHNKIVSAVLMDNTNNNDIDIDIDVENTENTIIPSVDNISNHCDSRIEIIMEDKERYLTSEEEPLPPPNINTTLIVCGNGRKQRIAQYSMSSMELKKYKMRKDSEVNIDTPSTLTSSSPYASEINEVHVEDNGLLQQSASTPQIYAAKMKQNMQKPSPPRPKTAHIGAQKHDKDSDIDSDTNTLTNSTENRVRYRPKQPIYLHNDIPSMRASASAPNIHNTNALNINTLKAKHIVVPAAAQTVSPSTKGLRRSPQALPKPKPNKKQKKQSDSNVLTVSPNKRYQIAMQHQMIKHHQRHQRTLQPGNKNPATITRNDINLHVLAQKRKKKKNRHMSEPYIMSPPQHKHNHFVNGEMKENPLSESSPEITITPIQFIDVQKSKSGNIMNKRLRSKSNPTQLAKENKDGFVMDKSAKKKKKKHKKRKPDANKRKSSTPTVNRKKPRRRREGAGEHNPFQTDAATDDHTPNKNKNTLHPSMYIEKSKNPRKSYYDSNYYAKYAKHSKLEAQSSGHSNLTNSTHFTATTISETPVPREASSTHKKTITMTPINIELINQSLNTQFLQQSPNKTTTISSAMVPPPPSPQLTKKKYNNLSPSPSPSFRLNDNHRKSTDNSTVTATFDDGALPNHDSDSTLSQDTANSGTNKINGRTPTPRTDRSNTETVTYRNAKYSVGSPVPISDIALSDDGKIFEIRVEKVAHIIDEANQSSDTETLISSSSSCSSSSDNKQIIPPPQHVHIPPDMPQKGGSRKQHYIVGSLDSDKMFIPPVPMQEHMVGIDEEYAAANVPARNPYAQRKLRPLPDTGSIGTISPEWAVQNNALDGYRNGSYHSASNMSHEYMEYEENETEDPEEKSFNPLEAKQSVSTQLVTFPSITNDSQSRHTEEYYFQHQLEGAIKSLTKSENDAHSAKENGFVPHGFVEMDGDNIWQKGRDLNLKQNNNEHYVE